MRPRRKLHLSSKRRDMTTSGGHHGAMTRHRSMPDLLNVTGTETEHIMVEAAFEQWDTLVFRDYFIEHPDVAREYSKLKEKLFGHHRIDREAYTKAKTDFIRVVTERAKQSHKKAPHKHESEALSRRGDA